MSASNSERGEEPLPPSLPGRLIRGLTFVGAAIAALLVIVMLASVSYSVFMRYVLGTPITWTDELSGYLVVALVMFGTAEALIKGDHFGVDLLTTRLRGAKKRAVAIWGMIAVILVGCAILYSAILMVRFSWDFGMYSEGYMEMPMWLPQSALIVGSILLIVTAAGCIAGYLVRRSDR